MDVEGDPRKEMKVHLFGLPISIHRRLKEESWNWRDALPPGHGFRATPSFSNSVGLFSESELRELINAAGEGFTHIVIPANRDWLEIKKRLQFDCRIHLARLRQPLRDLTWPILQENLHSITKMDEAWLDRLSPKDLKHALLLPPPVFATNTNTSDYWRRCDVYSTERFESAEKLLAAVEVHHRRHDPEGGRSWLDDRSRRYRIDPSKHGRSHSDRAQRKAFRFCYEIPPGFHYDVTEDSGRTFKIDIDGRSVTLTHCNVTPWGHVRRG
jgi:hypothetical protein